MRTLRQGFAAIALVASLGLVMPGAFGGPAAADPKPGQGTTESPRLFYCDVNGDGVFDEAPYEVVSQSHGYATFHDLHSTTVLTALYDQTIEKNVPFDPALGDPVYFTYDPRTYNHGNGQKGGPNAKVVPCHEGPPGAFRFVTDITACCPPLVEGAQYHVYESRTWYVMLSGGGKGAVKTASADDGDAASADLSQPTKHKSGGKHRSKSKRGR